jgi:hypothetical protein
VLLDDEAAHSEERLVGLKHGTGKDSHIVLSPQPSDDPNDPLNWPLWKKDMIIAILCLGAMLNAGTNVRFCFLHGLAGTDQLRGRSSTLHTSSSPNRSGNHFQLLYLFRAIISLRQAAQDLSSVLSVENTANDPFSWLPQSSISLERQSARPKLVIITFSQHASYKVSPLAPLNP